MAMDVGGSKGGPKSDINVTPLVDVMLVLLIIMMLVAPMLQKGVDVKLPQAANARQARDAGPDRHRHHGGRACHQRHAVREELREGAGRARDRSEDRSHQGRRTHIAHHLAVMDRLREAQIENIGLVTERKIRGGSTGGR
jgi:biopolymer transport protein ExbD